MKSLLQFSKRHFGPKAGKPSGGGGPPAAAKELAPVRGKTVLQKMVESGEEMIMGPPAGINKTTGTHRDNIINKLEPRMNLYARKLREMYFREGTIPTVKTFIDPLRERLESDTLENCMKQRLVPGVI